MSEVSFTLEGVDGVRSLAARFGRMPEDLRRELRPALRAAATPILSDMKARAGYSTRIPGAIRMTVSFDSRRGGIRFRVNADRAPHARVLERGNHGGRAETFRHPVFGDTDRWVSQPTRPFFFPALQAGRPAVRRNILTAVRKVTR